MSNSYKYAFIYRVWCYKTKKSYIAYSYNRRRCVRAAKNALLYNKKLSKEAYDIVHSDYVRFNYIEDYPCDTLNQLLLRVDEIIKGIDCVNIPLTEEDKDIMKKYKWSTTSYRKNRLKKSEDMICECGAIIKKSYYTQHIKTKKHHHKICQLQ